MAAIEARVTTKSRELLESLFRTAVAAAHPARCLPAQLPQAPPRGRLVVLAAGKAAGSFTEVAETHYAGLMGAGRLDGVAVTRHGYGRPTQHIAVVEAGHPVPDEAGLAGTERALALADAAGANASRYAEAAALLADLHQRPLPQDLLFDGEIYTLPVYDLDAMLIEVELALDWYAPAVARGAPSSGARAICIIVLASWIAQLAFRGGM